MKVTSTHDPHHVEASGKVTHCRRYDRSTDRSISPNGKWLTGIRNASATSLKQVSRVAVLSIIYTRIQYKFLFVPTYVVAQVEPFFSDFGCQWKNEKCLYIRLLRRPNVNDPLSRLCAWVAMSEPRRIPPESLVSLLSVCSVMFYIFSGVKSSRPWVLYDELIHTL